MNAIHNPATIIGNNGELYEVKLLRILEPLVKGPSVFHWKKALKISANPSVAIAR
jgi:hypothetical protein